MITKQDGTAKLNAAWEQLTEWTNWRYAVSLFARICYDDRDEATSVLRQMVKAGRVEKRTSVRAFTSVGYWEVRAVK